MFKTLDNIKKTTASSGVQLESSAKAIPESILSSKNAQKSSFDFKKNNTTTSTLHKGKKLSNAEARP